MKSLSPGRFAAVSVILAYSTMIPNVVADIGITNGGFETVVPIDGFPINSFGVWGGNPGSMVTAEHGVTPLDGSRMLTFSGISGTTNIWQMVDVSSLSGTPTVTLSSAFNRLAGSPSNFQLRIAALDHGPPSNGNPEFDHRTIASLQRSVPDNTWSTLSLTAVVPPGTVSLAVEVAYSGLGGYADNVQITAEPFIPPPPGPIVIGGRTYGLDAFADIVVDAQPLGSGHFNKETTPQSGANQLTLPADFDVLQDAVVGSNLTDFVSLRTSESRLTLGFTDIIPIDGPGADLAIFEMLITAPISVTIGGTTRLYASQPTGDSISGASINSVLVDLADFGVAMTDRITISSSSIFNDIAAAAVINGVPEPSSMLLGAIAVGGILLQSRRAEKKRSARSNTTSNGRRKLGSALCSVFRPKTNRGHSAMGPLSSSAAARKCEKTHQSLDGEGGRDVTLATEIRLQRFQAQLCSIQMGNHGK